MVDWIELSLREAELFDHMMMLTKYHTIWQSQNGTCFTNISSGQKLANILEKYWLDEICPKWVDVDYMDNRRPRKIGSHNGAR